MSILTILFLVATTFQTVHSSTKHYYFTVENKTITRLCRTRTIVTVNGEFPGPQIEVDEEDRVIIEVTNKASSGISIHWHGVYQKRTCWFDGPSYVTQCPIQPGNSFTYNFTVVGQRGTLWWHAHAGWLRATVYGAFIIQPSSNPLPEEHTIILGQWWNSDVSAMVDEATAAGVPPNISDALTINGLPGLLYGGCSESDTARVRVAESNTHLLRLVNAAMQIEMFFGIANHTLEVIEIDASYVKPFNTSTVVIGPGQSMNVLITTGSDVGSYLMAARAYSAAPSIPIDNTTSSAILEVGDSSDVPADLPDLPGHFDTAFVTEFEDKVLGLVEGAVPTEIDKEMVITVSMNVLDCPPDASEESCQFFEGRAGASMNNISYVHPNTSILEAFYTGASSGVYTTDFPQYPPVVFDYTGPPPANLNAVRGTKVHVVEYGTRMQVILQGTSLVVAESHPMHLHGFDFFVVGRGLGNYNSSLASTFNLWDPPKHNTVQVPAGGWTALRFLATNPGAWYFHCHLDFHLSVGLGIVLIVENGDEPSEQLVPPPVMPAC
ncbi:laccase-4 isoform X2 [Selaginella moellendorffii]|uniref:laccase-4 isoform X2 n=1 Tax=Selaginella moellendorffii TaxID=88036 RepID=UPI000D1CC24B|nr:laccase-4 isoform X2 [Selaginella moellendorffii]XP_024524865.1 laccase-4 isoform X2 [Selaginella moellendorffii]|eukprot:XP_024521555.1 laccase-4 isoform X2 [Selaginella moellendorffii]